MKKKTCNEGIQRGSQDSRGSSPSSSSNDASRARNVECGEGESSGTNRCDASRESGSAQSETIDTSSYIAVVANDPFHPGRFVTLYMDANEVASAQMMGYGNLDGRQVPVVRVFYNNGTAEDVFDAYGRLLER